MATPSLSSTTQSIGHAGMLTLSFIDPTGAGNFTSVSFIPTLAKFINPQFSPIQHVNVAVNGSVHIFQLGLNEIFKLNFIFTDLPYSQAVFANTGRFTDGFGDLLSFIRFTLNYHEKTCVATTPDGAIEVVRYMKGIDSFVEATGMTQKVEFYSGQLEFWRKID